MSEYTEPADAVAIIGMSCRFAPDLDSLDKYWEFLARGQNSVTDMPYKRWAPYASSSPQATAIMRGTTRRGSFLDDIEGFDADFFGVSPREADFLDPQQRFMLELAWEALVQAGVPPLSLRGSEAGVFMATNSNDYGRRLLEDIPRTGAYAVNGTTFYGIANRISYFLDLRGPSMAIDTACAGSLTALHLACQSLQTGETPVAIVGGINIMATPALVVALDGAGATAPDGRSKAFDEGADGYGRGEGAGVVVLKRLADALRDGDPVQAVVRGTGVFQDGRSDGMMAPHAAAQEHMLRQAYTRSGIAPDTVDYIEAHGTGTPVGDREEAQALARVFGAGRPGETPCLIGSVKPNIGHTEGGSGIAGIIKTVLAMQHEEIPPSLHAEPTSEIDWVGSGLRLVGKRTPWPVGERARRAGVSSYGVGGTIAHAILEDAPPRGAKRPAAPETGPAVFPVSAMSDAGLRAMAGSLADWLEDNPRASTAGIGHTLATRRSHLAQRGAVVAGSTGELTERLRAMAEGRAAPGVTRARTGAGDADEVVWVFSGHGAQWSGMGRELLDQEPAFTAAIDGLAEVFRAEMSWTPREAIVMGGPWSTAHVQAMTFAIQVGLATVWRSRGVRPGAVIGHSVGEIAAAVTAGALDVQEAARFACRRATALQRLEGRGGMALVGLPPDDAERLLDGRRDVVAAIAASPTSTVLSGDRDAVAQLAEQLLGEGVHALQVDTDVAFHSPHTDDVVDEVAAAAARLTPRAPQVALYSSTVADPRSAADRDAGYWAANLRQPVRFVQAVQAAVGDGHRLFLEVSSHPVVAHSVTETINVLGVDDATVVGTIRRGSGGLETLLGNLAELSCNGAAVDWSAQHRGGNLAALPTAAWQHRPFWIFPETADEAGIGGGHDPGKHSLLGGRMTVSGVPTRQVWQTHLDMSSRPYPLSHEVVGVEITPAASIINTFAEAAARDGAVPAITDIVLRTPLAVVPPRVVQIVLSENTLRLSTRVAGEGADAGTADEWITHTTAVVAADWALIGGTVDADAIRSRLPEGSWAEVDGMFRRMGVGGYAFPWDLAELRRDDAEQLAVMTIEPGAERASSWAHVIDGALTISAVVVTPTDAPVLWMSRSIERVAVDGEPPARIVVHSRRSPRSPVDTVDVLVADESGRIVCEVTGLRFAAVEHFGTTAGPRDLVHEIAWRPLVTGGVGAAVEQVVLVGDDSVTRPLAKQLRSTGVGCVELGSPEDLRSESLTRPGAVLVAPAAARDGEQPEQGAQRCAWTLVRTSQRLTEVQAEQTAAPQRIWCLTDDVRTAAAETSLAHGPLWGVARIVAGEHPELWGGVVDVAGTGADIGPRLLDVLRDAAGDEDVISLTGEDTTVARLAPVDRAADGATLQCRPTGTYLITGGLGALGLEVAHWLVDRGARRLLLAGRRGLPPRSEWGSVREPDVRRQIDGVLSLEALGVTVGVVAVDITDADAVAATLDPSTHGLPPVRGIVHAAGVTHDAMLGNVNQEELREVLAPKADGTMVLHRQFPPGSLDFFVLFSSCGQFARLTGQTSYAAANSFLDTLAAHRNSAGHAETVSLGWTSWQGVGMSESIGTTMLEANSRGLAAISVTEAFRAWGFADRFRAAYQAILRVLPAPPHAPRLPMFRELTAADSASGGDAVGQTFAVDWSDPAEAYERITAEVREQVAGELNLDPADMELKRPLVELGVDSVMTVALRIRLQRRFGLDLPPTILWSCPTVAALVSHLADALGPRSQPTEADDAQVA